MPEFLLIDIKDRIATLSLNRPEKRNALNPALISELRDCFQVLEGDENVKVVILKANGDVFSAGADLAYLQQLQSNTYEQNLEDSGQLKELFLQMYQFPKIIIAQVEGDAIAGGCGLVSVCDMVFSVPDAKFGYTEVKIGFVPALVSAFLLRRIGEGRSKELLLSGKLIDAGTAAEYGLVNLIEQKERIADTVRTFAEDLVRDTSSQAVRSTKHLLNEMDSLSLSESLELAVKANAEARLTDDCKKGIAAFLSKQKPGW